MKKEVNSPINTPKTELVIQHKIHVIRNQSVILDFDLAALYEVETRVLKQAVRRNIERFPEDFMFELERTEYNTLRSQTVILESGRGKHSKYDIQRVISKNFEYGTQNGAGVRADKRSPSFAWKRECRSHKRNRCA
jgi:hypothetical protein